MTSEPPEAIGNPKLFAYQPDSDSFNGFALPSGSEEIVDLHFVSRKVGKTWQPIPVSVFECDYGDGDFPSLADYSKIPVVSQRAWDLLRPLIGSSVEALPLVYKPGRYYLINVLDIIDCLDEDRSQLSRNAVTGRVNRVYSYAFVSGLKNLLQGRHVFKTPPKSGAELFVDQKFREVVDRNHLKGLLFEELPVIDRLQGRSI